MPYTIYKNVQVLSVKQEVATRTTRPQEIADPARTRTSHMVNVARFSGVDFEVAVGEFKKYVNNGQSVSIAVDEKWELIAIVNLSTGAEASIKYSTLGFSEVFSILFYAAIPVGLCFLVARKAFDTEKYHDAGWYIMGAGVLIALAIFRGVNKDIAQSRAALRELKG